MRIGVSSAVMYPEKSEKSFKALIEQGFDLFEFFYNCDEEISTPFIDELNRLKGSGEIISIHPYTAFAEAVLFFSGYERRTEESIEKYKRVFHSAQNLGVKYFTFHGDRIYGQIPDSDIVLSDIAAETLAILSDSAKEFGITLCLENVSWCKSKSPTYIKSVAEKVRNIGFTLDLKQARRAGVDYSEYLSVMGNRLMNIHVSDFDDKCDCLLPGTGKFDFKKFREDIKRVGYNGDILIEVYSQCFSDVSEVSKSKHFLENITNM